MLGQVRTGYVRLVLVRTGWAMLVLVRSCLVRLGQDGSGYAILCQVK